MKKLFPILFIISFNLFSTDFTNDETDFYVQGQDLNTALSTVNRYMCFISNGLSRGALLNKGPYKVLTRDDLCTKKFGESSSATDSSRTTSSSETQEEAQLNAFTDINYNNAIFNVTKESLTAPLKAQIWSNVNPGSTDLSKIPGKIFYDFSITKLQCTAARLAAGMVEGTDCTKYGNLTLDFTFINPKNYEGIDTYLTNIGFGGAGSLNMTSGMGRVEINDSTINYPILGDINVVGLTINELTSKLRSLLINSGQLTNPHVKINKLNSKYTVLGEVLSPGTYFNYENQLNIFQALGFAGDLLITAKRKDVKLIRQENGLQKSYEFSLNDSEIFNKPYYYIKSNDIIIIEPNYSKIKSAGFIGSPASIASISSLFLSITLLLINN